MYERTRKPVVGQSTRKSDAVPGEISAGAIPNSAMLGLMGCAASEPSAERLKESVLEKMPGRRSQADLLNSRAGTEKHLAPDVRSEMEQQFGRSMTGLTILESPEVRQAGARAYAKGNVIRFAPPVSSIKTVRAANKCLAMRSPMLSSSHRVKYPPILSIHRWQAIVSSRPRPIRSAVG